MNRPITVTKRNHLGEFTFRYEGEVLERGDTWVCLQAVFGRDDIDAGYVVFRRGDVMTEWFYSDRWYNIFRLQDVHTGQLKGWYCNLTRPAEITETTIAADDLALDLFIAPDGQIQLLDEDEFEGLHLCLHERAAVLAGVKLLRRAVANREAPFDEIV